MQPSYFMMNHFQLAQINVAKMKGVNLQDPIMQEFVENLDRVNELAERSPGFIWRLKGDGNDATSLNPFHDEQIIINVSVWKDADTLKNYVYKSFHSDFIRKRKEWFNAYGKVHMALWWIPAGEYPSEKEAVKKLEFLQSHGPTNQVFDFKNLFPKPH